MLELLKNIYSPAFLKTFSAHLQKHLPGIQEKYFLKKVYAQVWDDLELKQRMRRIAEVLHELIPGTYPQQLKVLVLLSKDLQKTANGEMSLACMCIPDFIGHYGLQHPEISLKAMESITCLSSCEFAIRPFILQAPDAVLEKMYAWSRDPRAMVRRLASEGSRPRLPWAQALPFLKTNPRPTRRILDALYQDPDEIVRRSVANHLNDISKDHPDYVVSVCKSWGRKSVQNEKLIKHACRTLLRKAHPPAMQLFGLSGETPVRIHKLKVTESLNIGEDLYFEFECRRPEGYTENLRLEYAIDYRKAGEKSSTRVFSISNKLPENLNKIHITRKQSFKNMTTRKHYPGLHRLSIRINGQEKAAQNFIVY